MLTIRNYNSLKNRKKMYFSSTQIKLNIKVNTLRNCHFTNQKQRME